MRLTGFSVENFKAIGSLARLAPLGTLNAIVGPNNEGKSSIIEALYLTRYLKKALKPPDEITAKTWMVDRLPGKDANRRLALHLEFAFDELDVPVDDPQAATLLASQLSVELGWGPQMPGGSDAYLYIREASVSGWDPALAKTYLVEHYNPTTLEPQNRVHAAVPGHLLSDIIGEIVAGGSLSLDPITPEELRSRGSTAPLPDGTLGDWISAVGRWTDRLIMVPSLRAIEVIADGAVDSEELNGYTLPARLSSMATNEANRFDDFGALIASLVGGSVHRIYAHNEGEGKVSIRVAPEDVVHSKDAFRLDTVGGGVNEIIYLAAMIWFSPPRSVILVEEPERGLHASSQRRFVSTVLDQAQKEQKQVFWATHSTVMAPLRADCSVFLSTLAEPTRVVITDIGSESAAQELLNALGHSNVDFYAYDAVILVDGETEAVALPPIIAATLGDTAADAVRVEDIRGDLRSRADLVRRILELLGDTSVGVVIFADDDPGTRETVDDLVKARLIQKDAVHIWDCRVHDATKGVRTAEFEDNFSLADLVVGANELGGGDKLNEEGLAARLREHGAVQISKVLEHYFFDEYGGGWSKPRLGQNLAAEVVRRIADRAPRGNDGSGLELEDVLNRIVKPLLHIEKSAAPSGRGATTGDLKIEPEAAGA